MQVQQRNRGFTLIELVVVIAILAILAAFALPRFAQLSEEAHRSSVKATAGAFSAGVALAKAQWVTNGGSIAEADRSDLAGFGNETLNVSEKGWAISTGTYLGTGEDPVTMTGDRCVQVWQALLQSNAPTIGTGTGNDYTAAATDSTCTFTYNLDGQDSTIEYDADTGEVTTALN